MNLLKDKISVVRELEGKRINQMKEMYVRGSHQLRFAKILGLLAKYVDSNTTFLEIGCAEGLYCGIAKTFDAKRVVGIDVSSSKLERARRSYLGEFYVADCEKDLTDFYSSFNFILCSEVLQHLLEPKKSVAEILKCIENEGLILVSTSNLSKKKHTFAKINDSMSPETLLTEIGGGGLGGKKQGSIWKFDTHLLEKELVKKFSLTTIERFPIETLDRQIQELFTVIMFQHLRRF